MTIDGRLSRLSPGLSAQQRAVLVLRAVKNGTAEDPAWRRTMPQDQVSEFNRLIELMNAANREVAFLIAMHEKEMEKLELYAGWLYSMVLWQLNLAEIGFMAPLVAYEAITESEHARLVAKGGEEYVSVGDLAEVLAEERRPWTDDDLERVRWTRGLLVKPEAWKRITAEAETYLRNAVADGELEGRGAGKTLAVKRASFDAWMGRPVTVYPKWATTYHVMPDDHEANVESDKTTLDHLRQAIEETPLSADLMERPSGGSNLDFFVSRLEESLEQRLRFRWEEIVTTEALVGQIAVEFGGEDPIKPASREGLQHAKDMASDLAVMLEAMGHKVEEPLASSEELSELWAMLERKGCVFRLS